MNNTEKKNKNKKTTIKDPDCQFSPLTFSWDLDTLPLLSRSRAVKPYQMDLSSSERRSMSVSPVWFPPLRLFFFLSAVRSGPLADKLTPTLCLLLSSWREALRGGWRQCHLQDGRRHRQTRRGVSWGGGCFGRQRKCFEQRFTNGNHETWSSWEGCFCFNVK